MALELKINDIEIDDSLVLNYPNIDESIKFRKDKLIASEMGIVLDNTENTFSKFNSLSIFFGTDWRDDPVTLFDTVDNIFLWEGKIKNIIQDDSKNTVTIKSTNLLKDIKDNILVYTATDAVTIAERILIIIRDKVGIPESNIGLGSFQTAIDIQDTNNVYIDIAYEKEHNISALSVIEALLELTTCFLYESGGKIFLYQWVPYAGNLGTFIKNENIIPGTFKNKSEDKVCNDYKIAYDNAGTVAFQDTNYGSSLVSSLTKFGTRTYNFPDKDLNSTAPADYKLLLQSSGASQWCGNKRIDRYIDMIEIVTITLSSDMNFLNLNDQGDLRFGDFVGEPMRITKKKPKVEKGIIEIEGELVNFPVVHYVRDSTPPVNVELIEVFPLADGRLFIKWTKSLETDHLGYNIYFTTTLGMWEQEQSNIGQSPIESKNPTDTGDGFVSIIVGDLNSGTKYFFKITSFDTSLNESEYSNVLSEVSRVSDIENILRLQGIIYSGLTLDVSNALLGSVPSGFTTYGDFLYDSANYEVTAIYESMLLINNDGWSSLISKGVGDSGDITFQYRVYNQDTATFGSWGSEADAIGLKSFSISGTAFQYRFIFKSPNWSNADSIIVKELI